MIALSLPLVEPTITNTNKYSPWELEKKIQERRPSNRSDTINRKIDEPEEGLRGNVPPMRSSPR